MLNRLNGDAKQLCALLLLEPLLLTSPRHFGRPPRSLFEKDKLLFAFLLSARIMLGQGSLDASQHQFLLTGTGAGGGDRGDLSGRGEGGEQPGRRWQG